MILTKRRHLRGHKAWPLFLACCTLYVQSCDAAYVIVGGSHNQKLSIGVDDFTQFITLGGGVGSSFNQSSLVSVNAVCECGGVLYVGGNFLHTGTRPTIYSEHIARWNPRDGNWMAVAKPGSVDGEIRAIECGTQQYTTKVIVGGLFKYVDGTQVNHIFLCDKHKAQSLGDGLNGPVYSISQYGEDVYVGGTFTATGGDDGEKLLNVAVYRSGTWYALGNGLFAPSTNNEDVGVVNSVLVFPHQERFRVLAGGQFTEHGEDGPPVHYFGLYNVSSGAWEMDSTLGSHSFNDHVYSIQQDGDTLFVGGKFTFANTLSANRIAKYDAQNGWQALESTDDTNGVNGPVYNVYSLDSGGQHLVAVAGTFSLVGSEPSDGVAVWRGGQRVWQTAVTHGLQNGTCRSIAVVTDPFYYEYSTWSNVNTTQCLGCPHAHDTCSDLRSVVSYPDQDGIAACSMADQIMTATVAFASGWLSCALTVGFLWAAWKIYEKRQQKKIGSSGNSVPLRELDANILNAGTFHT